MSKSTPITHLAEDEVRALHAFFVAWFRGAPDAPDFSACADALAADFRIIEPEGEIHARDEVVERLRGAHGKSPPDFAIEIDEVRPVWTADDAVLLEYVERQYRDGKRTERRSTALFTRKPKAPRGVEWRHLQETWIAAPSS